jgi:hypothetical protein
MDDDLRATGCPPWSRFEDVAGFDDDNGKKNRNVERVSALESVATTLDVVGLFVASNSARTRELCFGSVSKVRARLNQP